MPTILGESSLGAKYLVVQLVFSPYILLDDWFACEDHCRPPVEFPLALA